MIKKPLSINFIFLTLGIFINSCTAPLISTKKNLILYQVEVDNKAGYIDQKGKVRIEPIYDICSPYNYDCTSEQVFYWLKDEESFIVKKEGKFGLINYKGEQITNFIYDEMNFAIGNNFDVGIGNKYGMIDSQGNDLVPLIFSSPYYISADSIFSCEKNNKIGLYNNSTGYFLALDYYDVSPFNKGLSGVTTKSGMCGMINSNGDLVIDNNDNVIVSSELFDYVKFVNVETLHYEDHIAVIEAYGRLAAKNRIEIFRSNKCQKV